MTDQTIKEGKQDCYIKSQSQFNDKKIQLVVCEFISYSKDKLLAYKLIKAVSDYLDLQTATNTVKNIFKQEVNLRENNTYQLHFKAKIRIKTAQKQLKKLGLQYFMVFKNIYIDSHKRKDVIKYCQNSFLSTWTNLAKQIIIFAKNDLWTLLSNLENEEKLLVLVTHDESTFNANDRKRKIQKEKGKSLLRPKKREKRIIVSEFLMFVRRLQVPSTVSDTQLLHDSNWPLDKNQKP